MGHISNLFKITFIVLLLKACAPAHAQEPPLQRKLVSVICGELQPLIDYLNRDGFKMVFMGTTMTHGIFDSVWQRKKDQNFIIVRANQLSNEGCMVSNGVIAWSGFEIEEKISI